MKLKSTLTEISLSWWSTQKRDSKLWLSWKLSELNSRSKVRICHWTYESLPHLAFSWLSGVIFLPQGFSLLIVSALLQVPCDFSLCIHQAGSEAPELMFLRPLPFQTSGKKVHIIFFPKIPLQKVLSGLIHQKVFSPASIFCSVFSNVKPIKHVPKQINF